MLWRILSRQVKSNDNNPKRNFCPLRRNKRIFVVRSSISLVFFASHRTLGREQHRVRCGMGGIERDGKTEKLGGKQEEEEGK